MGVESGQSVQSRTHRRRGRVLAVVCLLVGLGYLARAAELQVIEVDRWQELARSQTAAKVEIPARRGGLYDRSGRPLALQSDEFRAYLAPKEIRDLERAVTAVDRTLDLTPAEARKLRSAESGWMAIPRRVSSSERDRLAAVLPRGVHFERVTARVFPQGDMVKALLGRVGPDGQGRSGLELALDSLLRGEPGEALTRRDARGQRYRLPDAELARPEPGRSVWLTIDAELQRIAEDALERALRKTGAAGGDVLMLDPKTGEILAVASRRVEGALRVPAFTDAYEPGSTLKPFLLASLLQEERAQLSETIDTGNGVLRRGGRVIRDVHPRDSLTVAEVVRYSSNVGAAKLADRLEPRVQYKYLRDFGFGLPSGIEYPGEASGVLRRPKVWSGYSQASLAMGYEVSVTSLQLAAAYGALANDGVLMRPYLVREIRDASGRVVRRREPEPVRRVIRPEVAKRVGRVLGSVVEGGTGSRAALATLPVAGKTGTARLATREGYARGHYAASFVGFTPVEQPNLVILTKLQDPQGPYYGGLTAAPISRRTLQAALATRGVSMPMGSPATAGAHLQWGGSERQRPERGPFVFAVNDSESSWTATDDREESVRVLPNLRGLSVRTAAARLHELGLRVRLEATGRVRAQSPAAGTEVRAGAAVVLR